MRDVIQKMLEAEAEARRIVAAAEAEAERLHADARQQGQQLADKVRADTRAEADAIIEQACREAQHERQNRLDQASTSIEAEIQLDETSRAAVVEGVVRCVCGRS